jgi:hypothetical protein
MYQMMKGINAFEYFDNLVQKGERTALSLRDFNVKHKDITITTF